MDAADDHDRADELAKKSAKLNEEQQKEYEKRVALATDDRGRVTDQFRLDIVNTLLQSLPRSEYGQQINAAGRREHDRIKLADSRQERPPSASTVSTKQPSSEPTAPTQDGGKRQPSRDDPMAGVHRHDEPRDYGQLRRTHEQVAAKQNAECDATADSATAILSTEKLQSMADRYAEVRKASNIELTDSNQHKDADQTKAHADDRAKLARAHDSAPNDQQKQERALLNHQQLAERVGGEALRLGQHCRRQGVTGAESYERDARSAFHTARVVHEQRQNLGASTGRTRDAARVVQQQEEQQKKSVAQEAARGGTTLTSEQRANASPDVKQTLDRKERAEAVRATGPEGKSQGVRQEAAKPGNTRPGGRAR